jgi:hypothetical protein
LGIIKTQGGPNYRPLKKETSLFWRIKDFSLSFALLELIFCKLHAFELY